MTRVLITGGTGFLGKHISQAFESTEYQVFPIGSQQGKYDLTSSEKTAALFSDYRPDVVIHAAAKCGGILANKNSPADFVRDNVLMGVNVLDQCVAHQVQQLVCLGSVCSYPYDTPVPFKEDWLFQGKSEVTNHPYGEAKKLLLTMMNAYRQQHGLKGVFLIPVNLAGEWDHFDLKNSHVIPALINKFVTAVEQSLPVVECWGTGVATREFFYAGDAARAIRMAVEKNVNTELPINLGTGADISIVDLATLIGELTGFQGKIEFTGKVSDGQMKRMLDVSRAKELLGFEAQVDLEELLARTIEWFKQNRK